MPHRHLALVLVPPNKFLDGGGTMGALMREFPWHSHPMGAPEDWPVSLRIALRILLTTEHPVFIWWGPEHRCFYNDGYSRSIGPEKHPAILGARAAEAWAEIWDVVGPQISYVMEGRGSTWHENQLIPIIRHGRREDVYWTYSYSPIDDATAPHGVGGVLVLCTETTTQVQSEQRQAFLVQLDDALRPLLDDREIIDTATAALGPAPSREPRGIWSSAVGRCDDCVGNQLYRRRRSTHWFISAQFIWRSQYRSTASGGYCGLGRRRRGECA